MDGRLVVSEAAEVGSGATPYSTTFLTTGDEMICDWIDDAVSTTREVVNRLDANHVARIIATIRKRFTNSETRSDYLWEDFVDDISKRCDDGWRIACEYPEQRPIIFFRDGEAYAGYSASSTDSLSRILAESPGFEFFLTNDGVDFVLCFNHHDCLIGVGKCKDWLTIVSGSSH